MARTTYIDLPEAQEELYYAGLVQGDKYQLPSVRRLNSLWGRKKIEGLTRRSYLPAISVIWRTFSDSLKADWKAISPYTRKHGWRMFVGDQAKRIKFGIAGEATPSALHQDMVGSMIIEAPATELKIAQFHPAMYYVRQKVQGTRRTYKIVAVTESLSLPLELSINYKSNLVSQGPGSFAKFYASVRHFYQGRNLDEILELNIPLIGGWANLSDTLTGTLGEVAGYTLFIHLYNVRGTLLFDLPQANHSGSNWVRDPFCRNISMSFTRGFYQVPKNWAAIEIPEGSAYDSEYPT